MDWLSWVWMQYWGYIVTAFFVIVIIIVWWYLSSRLTTRAQWRIKKEGDKYFWTFDSNSGNYRSSYYFDSISGAEYDMKEWLKKRGIYID